MEKQRKSFSRKTIWIIVVAAIIVVGAGVSAAVLLNLNPKQQYFSAELESWNSMKEAAENRYGDELDWTEEIKESPNESTLELSAEYNDPSGFDSMGIQEIVNSSTITLKNSLDPTNKEMALDLSANFSGITIEDIRFYLTSEKMMASLPFLDKFLQVKESELGGMLHELDPANFTGEEEIDFDSFFNQSMLSEEDMEHLQDTYLKMIYDELPEDAFTSEDEAVDVNGETLDSTKITLDLSEEQLKNIIEKVLTTAETDEKLKEIIQQQSSFSYPSDDVSQMLEDFDAGIAEAKKALNEAKIPNGLTSTLWVNDDLVVKRDFTIELGPSESELAEFTLAGTQLLQEENQNFDYTLGVNDGTMDNMVNLTGDLSWQDNMADDQIKISTSDMELVFTGTEELNDGTRDFDRTFSFVDQTSASTFELNWDGVSTYEQDQMNAEHNLSFVSEGMNESIFQLSINTDAKIVKSLDIDTDSMEVVDLGTMSAEEIDAYIQEEFTPQLQQWMMQFMGAGF
ncbi:hypothetical protein GH741_01650 [Aquibacillus halophilus]|uniref:DUF945 family protein n=1 Tax=Aquibacillus halophilus TaxID=930132 RepID=A0A6A8D6I6_9BACI|nr:DUF6583 family protein [Aquibacillus halophilus]MRH41375.1 hypothetical protein [Aquibacillus halophilus]